MKGGCKSGRGGFKQLRCRLQMVDIAVFTAEGDMGYKAKFCKDAYAAKSKVLRVAYGKSAGKFHHHIRTGFQRRFRTVTRLMNGGHTALRKAAAHQAQNERIGKLLAYQIKLMRVSEVKRVVFTDDANDRTHVHSPDKT